MKTELSDEAKLARREYYRKYREEHRDEIRAAQKRYREKHRDLIEQQRAEYWEQRARLTAQRVAARRDGDGWLDE